MDSSANESWRVEEVGVEDGSRPEKLLCILNSPEPPSLWRQLVSSIRGTFFPPENKSSSLKNQLGRKRIISFLQGLFPILIWGRKYELRQFKNDLLAGLTLASLSIPQSIGYANLAKLDPQYGLYTSIVPPLIYALMGSSREIAIGPVAVVSLLLSSMIQKTINPAVDPIAYRNMVFTATFFAGVFQSSFGFFRLGFIVGFLSHAAIVGFMGGAAIIIGLQQLKGLLGITHFTNKTDVISVGAAVSRSIRHSWNPHTTMLGCSFLIFILIARSLGRRNKKLFWVPAIAPLLSVILSTVIVFATRADKHGVKIVEHIKGGLNPISAQQLQFSGPYVGEAVKIGLISGVIALTEAFAVGRSFASIRGYNIDGNKEMVAMGFMNLAGSLTSCYVATGSFSRTAVNFTAGCQTVVSNIVMSVTMIIALLCFTKLLYFTPMAVLASIILSALPGLIDIREALRIWKVDKLDFLSCIGAFFGVLFISVEVGLLAAVTISLAKIILNSIRPDTDILGRIQDKDIFCSTKLYPFALKTPGVVAIRLEAQFLSFINANFIRERIIKTVMHEEEERTENLEQKIQAVILDMSNITNIDTSGIHELEEINRKMVTHGLQVAIVNPGWKVIHKLKLSKSIEKIGGEWFFLTIGEAIHGCLGPKISLV